MMKVCYSEMDTPAGLSCRLEAAGHAGYAPAGQDIVCAGASTVMQGLVYLLAGEENAHSEAFDEPDGPRLAVSVDAPCEEWVRGAFELAKACFVLLAERYPENVRFADVSRRGKESMMDLQLFAAEATAACGGNREPRLGQRPAEHECRSRHEVDAGSHNPFGGMDLQLFADGDGGAAGEGGAEATPAVQEPALRPAQERLARRSGALRGKASPAEQPPQLSGQPEMQPQEGEKPTEEKPQEQKAEKTPEEKRKAFGALVRDGGEYSDIFNEVMQQAIIKAGEAVHADPKAAALPQALSEAYGIDGEDVDGLIEAVKNGKVKDNAY